MLSKMCSVVFNSDSVTHVTGWICLFRSIIL